MRAVGLVLSSRRLGEVMKQPIERRLAAILAMDVVGYSRLMGTDEEGTLERLKSHRRELIDPKITEHRGRIVKTMGDGLLAEFPSVVDAVRCAVKIQRAMIDRNAEVASPNHITFRAGINLGDVIIDGDDIYGDGVNIAARLEALAEPGGICISRVVRDQIRDKLAYPFEDMGEQSVKNIARPVRAFAMGASVVASIPYEEMPPQSDSAQRRFHLAACYCWSMPLRRDRPRLHGLVDLAQGKSTQNRGGVDDIGQSTSKLCPFEHLSTTPVLCGIAVREPIERPRRRIFC